MSRQSPWVLGLPPQGDPVYGWSKYPAENLGGREKKVLSGRWICATLSFDGTSHKYATVIRFWQFYCEKVNYYTIHMFGVNL